MPYEDTEGFCKVATREDIEQQGFVLTPGRYVGTPDAEEDELPAAERLEILTSRLLDALDKSATAETDLRRLLGRVVGGE